MLDEEGVGQLVTLAIQKGRTSHHKPPHWYLRRAWRWAEVSRILPSFGHELGELLTLSCADCEGAAAKANLK